MNISDVAKQYYTELDDVDKRMIDERVAVKGIEGYLEQQLIYLDCSRVIKGLRMMQTIGYPYKREISSYLYALDNWSSTVTCPDDYPKSPDDYWFDKLIERHIANLEYEKENPPIWYDGKPKKNSKRKPKAKEGDMFPEETKKAKMSKTEAKLKAKLLGANVGFGTFKLKKN